MPPNGHFNENMETPLILLLLTGFAAGLMDAAVGGGGLLQLPALFGLMPAHTPIATVSGCNKLASSLGTAMATQQYVRKINVPWKMLLSAALLAFGASYLGAKWVTHIPVHYMKPAMLVMMLAMLVYTFSKKDFGQIARKSTLTSKEVMLGLFFGTIIGLYDGILGPGTGSLLTFVFIRFFAYDFLTATASAKIINLTTNCAALTFFVPHGHILWHWAIPLGLANLCGGMVGAHLAMRGGTRFLRYGFMVLLCVLMSKFAYDTLTTLM